MNVKRFFKLTERAIIDNSPVILTAIGVTGSLTAAYLTGKATFKAAEIIRDAEGYSSSVVKPRVLTNREKFDLLWKLYIPAGTTLVMSTICIVGANRIGTRRAAAVATAYTMLDKTFDEYKSKVIEKLGATKEREVRDEIAQDRVDKHPMPEVIIVSGDTRDVRCLDMFSRRYFYSNPEKIRRAENRINHQILGADSATVSDLYTSLGGEKNNLEDTDVSDMMGWNTDKLLEINLTSTLDDNDIPVLVMDFGVVPVSEPWRFPTRSH